MAGKQWTKEEEKMFEQSLAIYTERSPDQFEKIALFLNKPVAEVKEHYEALTRDLWMIESGLLDEPEPVNMYIPAAASLASTNPISSTSPISLGSKQGDNKQKKGNFWSVDEHRRFLIGLERYGKGDWRGISRNVVVTRTPSQIASHAQKYFKRQELGKNERKRSSIHDITIEDSTSLATPLNIDWNGQHETPIPLQSLPWPQSQLYQQPVNSTGQQETLIPQSQPWQQPHQCQQPVNSTGKQETPISPESQQWQQWQQLQAWQQSEPYQQPVNSEPKETPISPELQQWQQPEPYQQHINSEPHETLIPPQAQPWQQLQQQHVVWNGKEETPISPESQQWRQSQQWQQLQVWQQPEPYEQLVNSEPQETQIPPQAQSWQQQQPYQQPIDSNGQQETLIPPQP